MLLAAQNGHTEIVKLLIELNAAVNSQNQSGNTPLHMSIEYDYYELSKLLVEAGGDLEISNQKNIPSKKGIEGTKNYLFMPLLTAQSPAEISAVLNECLKHLSELEKSSFAGMGLRTKKQLGTNIWTEDIQNQFKSILLQITN